MISLARAVAAAAGALVLALGWGIAGALVLALGLGIAGAAIPGSGSVIRLGGPGRRVS